MYSVNLIILIGIDETLVQFLACDVQLPLLSVKFKMSTSFLAFACILVKRSTDSVPVEKNINCLYYTA